MSAYNRVNGESATASQRLLGDILREEWGFDGYVVSDCGAIDDIFMRHKIVATARRGRGARGDERLRPRVRQPRSSTLGKALERGLLRGERTSTWRSSG